MIKGIRNCTEDEVLTIMTNGGSLKYTAIGMNKLFPLPMHYNEHSIANVISLYQVAVLPGFRVTMNSYKEATIMVHYDGRVVKFRQCSDRLFYYNAVSKIKDATNSNNSSVNVYPTSNDRFSFLTTV